MAARFLGPWPTRRAALLGPDSAPQGVHADTKIFKNLGFYKELFMGKVDVLDMYVLFSTTGVIAGETYKKRTTYTHVRLSQ